jgi:hypothetical protein
VLLSTISHLDISSCTLGDTGGFYLAGVIKDMGTLSVLSLESNRLGPAGGKALAEGIKGNQVITELNIASNSLGYGDFGSDMSGVIALADAIPDMGALSSLNLAENSLCGLDKNGYGAFDASGNTPTRYAHTFTPHTWSPTPGLIALANVIPNMRALSSLNLASNCLCGLAGDGRGTFDAAGNAYSHHHTHLTRACSHRHYRPCQCHPRYGGHIHCYRQHVLSADPRHQVEGRARLFRKEIESRGRNHHCSTDPIKCK